MLLKKIIKKNKFTYKIALWCLSLISKILFYYDLLRFLKILPKIKKNIIHNKKDRILYTISRITHGGAERQFIKLMRLVKNKKIESLFLTFDLNFNEDKSDYSYLNKKDFKNLKIIKIRNVKEELKNLIKKKEIKLLLKYHSFNFFSDLEKLMFFHTYKVTLDYKPSTIHSYLDTPNIFSGIIGIILNINKIILNVRSISPDNFIWCRFFYFRIYKLFLKYKKITFVANSKNGAISYEKWLGSKKNKFKTLHNIFNFKKKYKKLKFYKKKIIFGTIGRLDENKNIIYSIKIIEQLLKNSKLKIDFYIIGEGILKKELINYVKKNNLENNIKFFGAKKNLNSFFNKIDVFIFTSKIEGTPNVLLEAQNYQLPIFSTNVGGISDAVIKNYTTFFLDGNNFKKDVELIYKKIKNKKFLNRRNFLYIKNKLSKFSDNEIYKNLIKIYNE